MLVEQARAAGRATPPAAVALARLGPSSDEANKEALRTSSIWGLISELRAWVQFLQSNVHKFCMHSAYDCELARVVPKHTSQPALPVERQLTCRSLASAPVSRAGP